MTLDPKDRKVLNLQAKAIDDLARVLKLVHKIARDYNDLAKQKRWNENRTMGEIEKESARGLTKLEWHGANLDLIRRDIPKQQKRLVE